MKRFVEAFDTPMEWAGWLMMVVGLVLAATSTVAVFEALALIAFGAVTAFGVRRYRGIRVGRDGLMIGGGQEDAGAHEERSLDDEET